MNLYAQQTVLSVTVELSAQATAPGKASEFAEKRPVLSRQAQACRLSVSHDSILYQGSVVCESRRGADNTSPARLFIAEHRVISKRFAVVRLG